MLIVVWIAVALAECISGCRTKQQPAERKALVVTSPKQQEDFAEFGNRLNKYALLRDRLEGELPPLKPTDDPEQILAHQNELAQKIIAARSSATQGNIFSAEIGDSFRQEIEAKFREPGGPDLAKTIRQGEPLDVSVAVNEIYPADLPVTTVPPSVLDGLPKLPQRIEYRVVGTRLLVEDVQANLIIDYMKNAFPGKGL